EAHCECRGILGDRWPWRSLPDNEGLHGSTTPTAAHEIGSRRELTEVAACDRATDRERIDDLDGLDELIESSRIAVPRFSPFRTHTCQQRRLQRSQACPKDVEVIRGESRLTWLWGPVKFSFKN